MPQTAMMRIQALNHVLNWHRHVPSEAFASLTLAISQSILLAVPSLNLALRIANPHGRIVLDIYVHQKFRVA